MSYLISDRGACAWQDGDVSQGGMHGGVGGVHGGGVCGRGSVCGKRCVA